MATASGKAVIGKSFQKKQVVQSKVKKITKSHQRKSAIPVESGSEKAYHEVHITACVYVYLSIK